VIDALTRPNTLPAAHESLPYVPTAILVLDGLGDPSSLVANTKVVSPSRRYRGVPLI